MILSVKFYFIEVFYDDVSGALGTRGCICNMYTRVQFLGLYV